jgi:hypothetical protein
MSGERSAQTQRARQPFMPADDFEPMSADAESDPSIPLLTPFQRHVLEGIDSVKIAQGEFTGEIKAMKAQLAAIVPLVESLRNDAVLAKKVLTYAKYVGFGLVTRYFPEFAAGVVKHAPAILEAAGKAAQ